MGRADLLALVCILIIGGVFVILINIKRSMVACETAIRHHTTEVGKLTEILVRVNRFDGSLRDTLHEANLMLARELIKLQRSAP